MKEKKADKPAARKAAKKKTAGGRAASKSAGAEDGKPAKAESAGRKAAAKSAGGAGGKEPAKAEKKKRIGKAASADNGTDGKNQGAAPTGGAELDSSSVPVLGKGEESVMPPNSADETSGGSAGEARG